MQIDQFQTPANIDDDDAALKQAWSDQLSDYFDESVRSVTHFLAQNGGGACQFYNPLTQPRAQPDLPPQDIPWNGFPKRFLGKTPGAPPQYAAAEPKGKEGHERPQDEYLEWFAVKDAAGKITSIQFTCEGYDYFEFLAVAAPAKLVGLYQQYIDPAVVQGDLIDASGRYNRVNRWNTAHGAMHLTNAANDIFAEVFLAASATVRRKDGGPELTAPVALCKCGQFGDESRSSDPTIGAGVNAFARQGRVVTLANPVGLYIDHIDESGFRLPDGKPAKGFFTISRGVAGRTLRASFAPPAALAAAGVTVSDLTVDGVKIEFGGQVAQKITMKLTGVASLSTDVHDAPVACGAVPDVPAPMGAAIASPKRPAKRG